MNQNEISKKFYEAIVNFEESEEAQDYYYSVMDMPMGKPGREEPVRTKILKAYGMLFCEDTGLAAGQPAGPDEVADTADRLYIGRVGYDSEHWYRMKHHFPVIDDDNYDRFAALVIADLKSGPLHDLAVNEGITLVVGAPDPLHMTAEQRKNQKVTAVALPGGYEE